MGSIHSNGDSGAGQMVGQAEWCMCCVFTDKRTLEITNEDLVRRFGRKQIEIIMFSGWVNDGREGRGGDGGGGGRG